MIDWDQLSGNHAAMDMILANLDKMSWSGLSRNSHPIAIAMLEANQDKIDWNEIGANIGIFKRHIDQDELIDILVGL